ncbi:MAG: hypothetical protein PHF00_13060, partial [Elusimicrobia bacterium]|nr:hypothetical protein [Elusimicrobiota bacterium]
MGLDAAAGKIANLLDSGAALRVVEIKARNQEIEYNFRKQNNLLGMIKGEAETRLQKLKLEARGLRDHAQARQESLQRKLGDVEKQIAAGKGDRGELAARKAALESELRLARAETQSLQRFESAEFGRAQRLIEKVYELNEELPAAGAGKARSALEARLEAARRELGTLREELSPGQKTSLDAFTKSVERLYKLGREMGAVDEEILAAVRAGRPAESLQQKLASLEGEAYGVQAELARARELARPKASAADLDAARAKFEDGSKHILELLRKGDPESQGMALRLLEQRKVLLDAFAGSESPIYKIYREMKADAYPVANSPIWDLQATAAKDFRRFLAGSAGELAQGARAVESPFKKREAKASADWRKRAGALLREQLRRWDELSVREPADHAALLKNFGDALDLAGLHAAQRENFLKELGAKKAGLEPLLVERLQSAFEKAAWSEDVLRGKMKLRMGALQMTTDKAVDLYARRIDGGGWLPSLERAPALRFEPGLAMRITQQVMSHPVEYIAKPVARLFGADVSIRPMDIPINRVGLVRGYAWRMMKEILSDPLMPPGQRDSLFVKAFSSWLSPRWSWDPKGSGSSWVRQEFLSLVEGYHDDYSTVRMDNLTGKTNVIHNGQWFETMDNPTRRFWELEYGTDITLPYTHKALSTIKDVTANKKVRMFAFSATAGEQYIKTLDGMPVRGGGAQKPPNVRVEGREGPSGQFRSAAEAMGRVLRGSQGRVVARPAEILDAKGELAPGPEVLAYLEKQGLAGRDGEGNLLGRGDRVLELESLPPVVRDYFAKLRAGQPGSTGLMVMVLPDTRMLKTMIRYLDRTGLASEKKGEIAKVFSDTEYLRGARPKANVAEQMNLDGMKTGKVKVLLLDARVGGRGLDLEYKGDRGNAAPEAFKGYTNYEMLIFDPDAMSAVHLLQAEGRIDLGRVLAGAQRDFRLVLNVKSMQKDSVFQDMFRNNPVFNELRRDPGVREFARQRAAEESARLNRSVYVDVDWTLIDAYVKQRLEPERF